MEESELRAWLIAMKNGDQMVIESGFPKVFNWVFRIAMRILWNEAKAEEAAGATMFKLYIFRERYESSAPAKPYVRAIVTHECLDIIRRESRLEPLDEVDLDRVEWRMPAPARSKLGKDLLDALRECWKKLPDLQKAALLVRYFAKVIPEVSGARLYRATNRGLQNLRDCLHKAGYVFSEKSNDK